MVKQSVATVLDQIIGHTVSRDHQAVPRRGTREFGGRPSRQVCSDAKPGGLIRKIALSHAPHHYPTPRTRAEVDEAVPELPEEPASVRCEQREEASCRALLASTLA